MKSEQIIVISEYSLINIDIVIETNIGFRIMKNISNILEEKTIFRDNIISEKPTTDDMAHIKLTPMITVDVERSFSRYKATMADNRRQFIFENVKQYLII